MPPTPGGLPYLIVGDVHGDLERLFRALEPYPADQWRTIFLGDLVDGGMFGVGALRYSRDRPNSIVLIGNHEVAMLRALRDPSSLSAWMSMGGQRHDLEELRRDSSLQAWVGALPALARLDDGTLVQHSDTDAYARLLPGLPEPGHLVEAVNRAITERLAAGDEETVLSVMSPQRIFRGDRRRLETWLERAGAIRLVHGHSPHLAPRPDAYHDGLAICFDGGFSRYHGRRRGTRPVAASVGPLPSTPAPRVPPDPIP